MKPDNRLTANEALCHEWMKIPGRTLSFVNLSETLVEFKRFNARRKFRAYVRTVMAVNRMRFILNSFGPRPTALTANELSGEGEAWATRMAAVAGDGGKRALLLSMSDISVSSASLNLTHTSKFEAEYEIESLISKDRVTERSLCSHRLSDKQYEVKVCRINECYTVNSVVVWILCVVYICIYLFILNQGGGSGEFIPPR